MRFLLISALLHLTLTYFPLSYQQAQIIASEDSAIRIGIKLHKSTGKIKKEIWHQEQTGGHVSEKIANSDNITGQKNKTTKQDFYHPAPRYPRLARERGWQGSVLIQVSTDEQGRVKEQNILKSSGFAILDREALETVKTWKTMANLQKEVVPITFKLHSF